MPLEEPLFSELMQRLDGERGMRRKVRLLAGSWSDLRKLSPEQREQQALAIGNRWAWRNIESLFGNPDELSDNQRYVKVFFEDLRDTEPDELRKVGREIKEGGFATAAKHVLGAVEEALDEETGAEDDSQGSLETVPEPSRAEPPVPQDAAAAPVIEVHASEPIHLEPPLEEEPAKRPSVRPPLSKPAPEPEPKPEPADSAVEPTPAEDTLVDDLRSDSTALSAVQSFRVLRRLSSGQVSSTRAGRAAMVGSLGSGWAARRAVSSIIRSHSVANLDEALALIRQLPAATQRTWCLGDLVQYWDLDDDARSRVLAAAPTKSARSRLAHRA